tara:strand:+ start:251 stop:391 length:141 start_codon:yes stop_codon:yes gene_type:complete
MESTKPLSFADIISASTNRLTSGQTLTVSDIALGLFASLICALIIS